MWDWIARWAFRRLVAKRVLIYIARDKLRGDATPYAPDEMEVVFRGK